MNPRRFLSLRDKNGVTARREKGKDSALPKSRGPLNVFSKPDNTKLGVKDEASGATSEKSETDVKIDKVGARLAELDIVGAHRDYIRNILASRSAAGDVERAVKFIDFQQQAGAGKIVRYDSKVKMAGAENRGAVTCYIDSLLFAMFARFDAFERMLKKEFESEARRKLATVLRLWVNLLRSGELIHTDTTELLQETLAECGWTEARLLEQQDTSEAFNFITETLELPLLSLKVDLFHHGKSDESDHKVIHERLLNLAVPPDPDGKGVKLEDCLEEYFNAQVDVLRDSLEDKGSTTESPLSPKPAVGTGDKPVMTESPSSPKPTIRLVSDDDSTVSGATTPKPEASRAPTSPRRATLSHTTDAGESESSKSSPPPMRQRSNTIIQRVLIDETGRATGETDVSSSTQLQRKGSLVVKAVTIPAWQFFRLMPWHTPNGSTQHSQPRSDKELEFNIRQRPVLGICLKRYGMTEDGMPQRQDTHIDIPDVLRLPNFILDDDEQVEKDPYGFSTGYKLVLQSVVCHRGDALQSGHYIALARVDPKLLTDNRRCDVDPPPDYEESQWVKFDNLLLESRVTPVEDLKQGLKDEMPYLLFYQIVPAIDSTDSMPTQPPAYNESQTSLGTLNPGDSTIPTSRTPSTNASANATPASISSKPSIRISSDLDLDRPALSGDDVPNTASSRGNSRPHSIALPDVFFPETASQTPGTSSPGPTTPSEETTAQRLSRAAARFSRGSRSRNASQQGESRASFGMKLGLLRTSKEFLREPPSTPSTRAPSADGREEEVVDEKVGKKKKGKAAKGERPHKGDKSDKGDNEDNEAEADRECVVM